MRCFKPIQTLQDPHCHTENHGTSKPESWNSESTSPLKIATTPQKQKPEILVCSPEVFFRPMAMSSFHRPRVYRSIGGCCICRAKSSSSRFTTSDKYENVFQACFRLPSACPRRSGEICNACVLLVKRYQKLPINSTRHWAHVVDARAGPGVKNFVKVLILTFSHHLFSCKNFLKVRRRESCRERALKRKHVFRRQKREESSSISSDEAVLSDGGSQIGSLGSQITSASGLEADSRVSDFIDLSFWKRKEICCGTIFVGPSGKPRN